MAAVKRVAISFFKSVWKHILWLGIVIAILRASGIMDKFV